MSQHKVKIIIIAHNEMALVKFQKENILLFSKCSESDIIIVDNGSNDGLSEWLIQQSAMDYILCDEGMEGYASILNAVIDEFVQDEDILIMSPNLFMLPGSMEKLVDLLYTKEQVGAVCANTVKSQEKEEMNFSTALEYVKKLENTGEIDSIIGLPERGVLIKNEMLRTLHNFDESLILPKSTLVDYSFRGVDHKYEYIKLQDNCFYEITSKQDAYSQKIGVEVDRKRLKEKWEMNYFNDTPNNMLLSMIENDSTEEFSVLEVGCDCGVNLLALKNKYHKAHLYGVEVNESAAHIASHIAQVQLANIEDGVLQFENVKFDYIIFGDVLEHLRDPKATVQYCRSLLKEDGKILASIPNIMHYSVMRSLLNGDFTYTDMGLLDKTHIHFFTYNEIMRLFNETGYTIEKINFVTNSGISQGDKDLVNQLLSISNGVDEFMYYAFQFLVKAGKA
ncbi:MAG TPA: bifunctional glycosyltransferase/class I SAM-dependent methyltransferase [Lachnospiraceae bacterium]|nr:bifunctional glycosyltransferase/class I SAM-dependent methyltransferase [Lachnospiraceae bacterium]